MTRLWSTAGQERIARGALAATLAILTLMAVGVRAEAAGCYGHYCSGMDPQTTWNSTTGRPCTERSLHGGFGKHPVHPVAHRASLVAHLQYELGTDVDRVRGQ